MKLFYQSSGSAHIGEVTHSWSQFRSRARNFWEGFLIIAKWVELDMLQYLHKCTSSLNKVWDMSGSSLQQQQKQSDPYILLDSGARFSAWAAV